MELKNKRVLVFGTGKSGIGAANLLEDMGSVPVLYDGNEKITKEEVLSRLKPESKAEIIIGDLPDSVIKELSLVVLSPGVPTDLPLVNRLRESGLKIWGEVELAYELAKEMCWPLPEPTEKPPLPVFLGLLWSMPGTLFLWWGISEILTHWQ